MKIAPAAAGLVPAAMTPAYARELAARLTIRKADMTLTAGVADDAAKARSSPLFDVQESRKGQARAKLQQLRDWLKIVRKLYAQNPQGMAKALAQAFKELKAAVQAYKDAGGEEMAAAGGAVAPMLNPAVQAPKEIDDVDETADPSAPAKTAQSSDEDAEVEAAGEDEDEHPDHGAPDEEPSMLAFGRSLYEAVVGEVRKLIGEDGLNFLRDVRSLVNDLRDLLQTARGQAAIRKRDKATDHAFEDADAALKDLNQGMDGMEQQIRLDAPMVSLKLSVAA